MYMPVMILIWVSPFLKYYYLQSKWKKMWNVLRVDLWVIWIKLHDIIYF